MPSIPFMELFLQVSIGSNDNHCLYTSCNSEGPKNILKHRSHLAFLINTSSLIANTFAD